MATNNNCTCAYCVLGVSPSSRNTDIKVAYRSLALRHHPDKHNVAERAVQTTIFQEITAAYTILKDPEPRSTYDIKNRERFQRWHPTWAGAIPTCSAPAHRDCGTKGGRYTPVTTANTRTTTRGSTTSTKVAAAELRSTAFTGTPAPATTAPTPGTYHWNSARADRYHRALRLERQGHLKRAEAQQLQNLIQHQVSVGSDRWYEKMKTVEALREEAEVLLSKAKGLKNEAAGLDTGSGKVKRARNDNAEARAKRARM